MAQMYPVLLLLLALSIGCYSYNLGDRRTVNACYMRAQASWSGGLFSCNKGKDSKSCLYNPPSCGWVIMNYKPVENSRAGASYSATLVSGQAKFTLMTQTQVDQYYDELVYASLQQEDFEMGVKLMQSKRERSEQFSHYYNNGAQTLSAYAEAKAQGSCIDRKRGWIDMYYTIELEYVGCTPQELTAEFDSDPDFKKIKKAANI